MLLAELRAAVPPDARLTVSPGATDAVMTPAAFWLMPPAPALRTTVVPVSTPLTLMLPETADNVFAPAPISEPPALIATLLALLMKEVAAPPE